LEEEIAMDEIMNKNLIVLDMEAKSKEEVIRKLAKVIQNSGRLNDYEGYTAQVFDREKEFPTAIGFDVAIPHGKTDCVNTAAVAFARLKDCVAWSDEEKARYVFLIAVPASQAEDKHLQILAQLSRSIMREEFREKLKNASSVEEILNTITLK
jgi:fructose PTS system EIIA component